MIEELSLNHKENPFLACSRIKCKVFDKGETITTYVENRNQICLLLEGKASLIRYDFNGNETVLDHFSNEDLFGELFYSISSNTQMEVYATEKAKVLFFYYDYLFQPCNKKCPIHNALIDQLLRLLSQKMISMNDRIEILTKRSIRDKLLSYFSSLSYQKSSKTFSLPLSLTQLASYLNIDRSAMMREMKYLKEEGFIKKSGSKITLLY